MTADGVLTGISEMLFQVTVDFHVQTTKGSGLTFDGVFASEMHFYFFAPNVLLAEFISIYRGDYLVLP